MKLIDLLKDINIVETNADLEADVTGISTNSARVRPGEVFIAVEGHKTDGHNYISDAISNGAISVICRKKPSDDIPYIITKDTRKAMSLICAQWFGEPAKKLKLVGITGTNGKTTITYMLKHILEHCGYTTGLIGTIENLIGDEHVESTLTTPDCFELQELLSMIAGKGCDYAVMEVSSHALSLDRVYGIEFETGVFTNLTGDHMDFHKTMDDYASAKSLLFQNSKQSVINADDDYAATMSANSKGRIFCYAVNDKKADFIASDIILKADKTTFKLYSDNSGYEVAIKIPGIFSVYNTLAAIGAAKTLGVEPETAAQALSSFPGVRGRAEIVKTDDIETDFTVVIDYAHTPDALENIISTMRSVSDGKIHTLFGCGGDRDKKKRPLMGKIAAQLSDYVTITTDNPRTENPEAIIADILSGIPDTKWEGSPAQPGRYLKEGIKVVTNRREAIREALDILLAGDILLIAGKGHETYQIIGDRKTHFDDREVVMEHLRQTAKSKREIHARG